MLPCVALSYATLHYLIQCYIKLHFFTLHSLMSHVISVALLYPPLHYIKLLYPMSTYAMSCSLQTPHFHHIATHYSLLNSLTFLYPCYPPLSFLLCYPTLSHISLHYTTILYILLYAILPCAPLHCFTQSYATYIQLINLLYIPLLYPALL